MITLKQLIRETEFDKVWDIIIKHYEISSKYSKDTYANFYKKLIALSPDINKDSMVIYIKVLKDDGNDNYYFLENFDVNDTELYFDVCGHDSKGECYALKASSFEEWLGFYIDLDTLSKLTYPSIVAHCIQEMTFFGFEQKRDENGSLIID